MYIKTLENQYFVYPMVAFSNINPNLNNDWSAWESDEQKFLAYSDIVWIAIDNLDFFEKEYTINIVSGPISLDGFISDAKCHQFFNESTHIWSGKIHLKKEILLIGDGTIGSSEEVEVGANLLNMDLYANFSAASPSILVSIS